VAVLLGSICLINNGASFSATFSTTLRVSHEAKISTPVREADADGRDPLPKYLAKAELSFPSSSSFSDETAYTNLREATKRTSVSISGSGPVSSSD
jgi:hypothetical protein